MPNDQASEKSSLLLNLGAKVTRLLPAPIIDQNHFVNTARNLATTHTASTTQPGRGFFANQFETPYNYLAHLHTTGPEIYRQTGGHLDAFVAGAGTGGTITGVALYLRDPSRLPDCRIILADPQGSGLYNRIEHGVMFSTTEREGTRRRQQVDTIVEGIGINRITANFEAGRECVDGAVKVTDEQAMRMARWLVEKDGIFAGSSSAVNVWAAVKVALDLKKEEDEKRVRVGVARTLKRKTVVTILCDSGTRHLSKFWAKAGETGGKTDTTLEEVMAA